MHRLLSVCLLVILTGCATKASDIRIGPPAYKEGFAEGCDSGYVAAGHPYYQFRKDTIRYTRDDQYKQGWNDGFATCKGQYDAIRRSL